MPRTSYALKTFGSSTITIVTAALIGVLCLGGASTAAPAPTEPLFGLVVTRAGNPPETSLARLDPVALRPVGTTLRLGEFYPRAVPFVRSPDGRLGAVAHWETLWVVDLVRLVPIWKVAAVPSRLTGRGLPIDSLSWPSRRRLIATSVLWFSEVVVLDPVARRIQRVAVPELVDGTSTPSGMVLLAGRLGEPLRIVSIDQRRRIVVLKRLWRGIEPKASGRKGLPPVAARALEFARRSAAAEAGVSPESVRVQAVVPRVWPSTALGCPGRLGLRVVTEGYRVLVSARTTTYDYRVALRQPPNPSLCLERPSGEINVPANNLLRSGAADTHVTDAVHAAERSGARGFVVTSGGLLGAIELRSGRVRYRKLRPAIIGGSHYGAAHVSRDVLVASAGAYAGGSRVYLVNAASGRGRPVGTQWCQWRAGRGVVAVFGSDCDGVEVFDGGGRKFDALFGRKVLELVMAGRYLYALEEDRIVHVIEHGTGRQLGTKKFDGAILVNP